MADFIRSATRARNKRQRTYDRQKGRTARSDSHKKRVAWDKSQQQASVNRADKLKQAGTRASAKAKELGRRASKTAKRFAKNLPENMEKMQKFQKKMKKVQGQALKNMGW